LGTHFYARLRLAKDYEIENYHRINRRCPSRAWAEISVPKQELGNEKKKGVFSKELVGSATLELVDSCPP